jgi:hypothetical protein
MIAELGTKPFSPEALGDNSSKKIYGASVHLAANMFREFDRHFATRSHDFIAITYDKEAHVTLAGFGESTTSSSGSTSL